MSRFTRQYLRIPRVKTLLGLVNLQTGTELVSLALVFNKVTGFYGLLAILTGYQLSLLQLSTYLYSIVVLGLLAYLVPHIRKQSPFECLALAWLYILDTVINSAYTAAFGMTWYLANTAPVAVDAAAGDGSGKPGAKPEETATSMVLIVGLTLIRIYFSMVVMAYARMTLQQYTSRMEITERDGPFAEGLPGGQGRKGRLGRLMLVVGRGFWLEQGEQWAGKGRQVVAAEV
ncbi:Inositolphosphorylceramide synthase subunit Kei1-domain-containing protein [Stachybotrys elegans]|uniref:Inositolphosphorylceramide synthase subunit Kei1-domain-containing protein n=1 Tax=Stachybotrys elegans TaxID=80388 RepID=A0A8K0SS26_9HYPO|nr:Inositolphosphorylceramide synthase subunit Kei1-domain-containing protein [Stachybotrys elegans]